MTATEDINRTIELVMRESECSCPNYTLIFECTVRNSSAQLSIIWNGSIFNNCNGILLSPPVWNMDSHCNKGAIIGSIMPNENSWYTSQLNITLNFEIIGKNVLCFHSGDDINSMVQVKEIGSSSITGL